MIGYGSVQPSRYETGTIGGTGWAGAVLAYLNKFLFYLVQNLA